MLLFVVVKVFLSFLSFVVHEKTHEYEYTLSGESYSLGNDTWSEMWKHCNAADEVYTVKSPSISIAASCQDGFDTNCLNAHNDYRKKHGSPPMTWSASLASDAQKWADQLAREDKFEHDMKSVNSKNQGENLAYFSPPKKKCMGAKQDDCVQCSEIVADWYNEVKDYDFTTGKAKQPGRVYLHFTQVVWKGSLELGVGVGINNKKYGFITVARYSPRGNMGGAQEFKKNVSPEGAVPSVGPGTTPPTTTSTTTSSAGPGTTSTPLTTSKPTGNPPSTKKPEESSNCEYLIITTITKQQKIIQKCKGKPNVTFVPTSSEAVVGEPQPPKTQSTSILPTTLPITSAKSSTNSATTTQTRAPSTPGTTTLTPSGGTTGPTAPSTGPTNPSQKPQVEKDQHDKSIMLINLYRVMHSAGPLFWNEQLAKESQAWAENIALKGTLDHDTSMKDGENIAKLPANNSDVMNAVDAWYDEEKLYDYKNPKFSKATGHFTQLVWKDSKEMGLGIAPSMDNSEYYIVARFRPSGNVQGKFAVNVGAKVST